MMLSRNDAFRQRNRLKSAAFVPRLRGDILADSPPGRPQESPSSGPIGSFKTERGSLPMPKEEAIEAEGRVTEALANTQFRVELDNGHQVLAHVAGKMRKHFIRIVPGDRVVVQVSPYDYNRGRIVYRER